MSNLKYFIADAITFVIPDQLHALAHTSSLARDIVMRCVRSIPRDDRNYPEHTSFMRALTHSSLTALQYARETSNAREDIHSIRECDEYLIWLACRYDDLDLVKFLLSKGIVIYDDNKEYDITRIYIRSIPKYHPANNLVHHGASNQTTSWCIFRFALEHYWLRDVPPDESQARKAINVNISLLANAAMFANNVKLLRALDSVISICDVIYITIDPYICAITDEVASFLSEKSYFLKREFARNVSSFDHIIAEPNHPLFAQHNALVDLRHIFLDSKYDSREYKCARVHDRARSSIPDTRINTPEGSRIMMRAIWNMRDERIARNAINYESHDWKPDIEVSFIHFSSFAREMQYVAYHEVKRAMPPIILSTIKMALSRTLVPIRILFKKYPNLISLLNLESILHDINMHHTRARVVIERDNAKLKLVLEREGHTVKQITNIMQIISEINQYDISIKPIIEQSANYIKNHICIKSPRTRFALGALLCNCDIMHESKYALDMHKYQDRVLVRFILNRAYIRVYGSCALAFIDPHNMTEHKILFINHYCNLTNTFAIIMQRADVRDLMEWREFVRSRTSLFKYQTTRIRLLIDIIISALLREHRIRSACIA